MHDSKYFCDQSGTVLWDLISSKNGDAKCSKPLLFCSHSKLVVNIVEGQRSQGCFCDQSIRFHSMYQDLHLPVDDVNTVVHRDRLAMLLCLGYESAAAVHSTSARLTETDRWECLPSAESVYQQRNPPCCDRNRVSRHRMHSVAAEVGVSC